MANNTARIQTGLGVPNTQSLTGTGTPLGNVSASVGAIYTNLTDGSLWTKTSGTNTTTGWVAGASAPTVVSISASATASSWNQIILVDASAGNVTVTLPTASLNGGKSIEVKKIDSTNYVVIVDANAAETIDGELTQTITGQYNNARFVSNGTNVVMESLSNGVLAEYGAVQVDNQIFSGSDTFVNSTNGIYAIPSAGIWLLTYELSTDGTGANTTSQVAIHSPTATVVSGSERVRGGGVTVTSPLSCSVLISTTGPATYRLVGRRGGSGSMTIINSALTTSGITWQKIGGFAPISGQTVDHLFATMTSDATIGNGGTFQFTTQNGNLTNSSGIVTLPANKTFYYSAKVGKANLDGAAGFAFQFRNLATNTLIGSRGQAVPPSGVTNEAASNMAWGTITTGSTPVNIRLENTEGGTRTAINGQTSLYIVQIGSTATTGVPLTLDRADVQGISSDANGQVFSYTGEVDIDYDTPRSSGTALQFTTGSASGITIGTNNLTITKNAFYKIHVQESIQTAPGSYVQIVKNGTTVLAISFTDFTATVITRSALWGGELFAGDVIDIRHGRTANAGNDAVKAFNVHISQVN
jgi:hypothetical protein